MRRVGGRITNHESPNAEEALQKLGLMISFKLHDAVAHNKVGLVTVHERGDGIHMVSGIYGLGFEQECTKSSPPTARRVHIHCYWQRVSVHGSGGYQ